MKLEEFDYDLPEKYIAQNPPKIRGRSNLLVLDKQTGEIDHKKYFDVARYIKKGDVVVLNKTKVLKARIFPKVRRTGRQVEVLFLNNIDESEYEDFLDPALISALRKKDEEVWYGLIGRARHVQIGDILEIGEREIKVIHRREGDSGFIIKGKEIFQIMEDNGHVPLPPYIKRDDSETDEVRYNTVFGQSQKSVAAPTASLNLTQEILQNIKKAGAQIAYVSLNIGWGTFAPVNTEEIEDFDIHSEYISIPMESVDIINNATGRIWAFGTTVVRTLESVADEFGKVSAFSGESDLYIYPPYKFKAVDVLVTNFHSPQTSLVMLVSAFAGKDNIKKAYEAAKSNNYKFLSYGDSMLII
jgi:S-adenosylmethionine:tRNA ribosyltransferase-isomerase